MGKQMEVILTVLCLLMSAIFLTIIIIHIRGIYFKKKTRLPVWNEKVNILIRSSKLIMAISLLLAASGAIFYLFFVSTLLTFVNVHVKITFCIIFGLWILTEVYLCFTVSQKLLDGPAFKRMLFFIAGIVCVIGASYLFPPLFRSLYFSGSNDSILQLRIPETPCGLCASAYFKAFNSGNSQQMEIFINEYRSKSYIKSHTMQKLIESYKFMYMVAGTLTPVRFIQISNYEIIVFAKTRKQGQPAKTRFEVDISEPHHLLVYTITPTTTEEALQITSIDPQIIKSTIDSLAAILRENYVYPEKGKMMADSLIYYQSTGRYSEIDDGAVLSLRLTEDLWPICYDKHLTITYGKLSEEDSLPSAESDIAENYGFESIEVLKDNIGYIRLDEFQNSTEAKEVAAIAFEKVNDCDALIFDLRYNVGGSPELVNFIYSYLFNQPTYMGSRYNRISNDTTDFWTQTDIPGDPIDADLPLYILTSSNTFSAGEEFAYFLKDLKRAVVIGEITGGGAHPVIHISVNGYFGIRIPYARMISPVSRTDWEGTGVVPNKQVAMDEALEAARKDAARILKLKE